MGVGEVGAGRVGAGDAEGDRAHAHFEAGDDVAEQALRAPRRLLRQDERRAQVLRAAAAAFARAGFAATSMDDVAVEAGITRLIVYRHFESKEELYRAVLVETSERLRREFEVAMALGPDRRRGVFVGSLLRAARVDPDGFRLLLVHARREPAFRFHHDHWWEQAVAVAETIIAASIPDGVTRAWAARTLVGYVVEAVLAWLDAGDPARDDMFVAQGTDGLVALFQALAHPTTAPG